MKSLFVFLFIFGLSAHCAIALECMSCTAPNPFGPCDEPDETGEKVTCTSNYKSCAKLIEKDNKVSRGCDEKTITKDECVVKDSGRYIKECRCMGDKCNGGQMQKVTFMTTIASMMVVLIAKNIM